MSVQTLFFALGIALAFAAVWWGTSKLELNAFLVPFLSALAAALVFFSHSLLGIKL